MAQKAGKKPVKSKKKGAVKRPAQRKKVRGMSDKPKPFPYHAAEARDRSAEEAAVIVNEATRAIEETSDPGLLRRLGRILASSNVILRLLEGQGAKTRPGVRETGRQVDK